MIQLAPSDINAIAGGLAILADDLDSAIEAALRRHEPNTRTVEYLAAQADRARRLRNLIHQGGVLITPT